MASNEYYRICARAGKERKPTIRLVEKGTFAEFRKSKCEKANIAMSQVKVPVVLWDQSLKEWFLERVAREQLRVGTGLPVQLQHPAQVSCARVNDGVALITRVTNDASTHPYLATTSVALHNDREARDIVGIITRKRDEDATEMQQTYTHKQLFAFAHSSSSFSSVSSSRRLPGGRLGYTIGRETRDLNRKDTVEPASQTMYLKVGVEIGWVTAFGAPFDEQLCASNIFMKTQ
ncbi:hypothetical protein M405DRAFT_881908 [Rhizopogon salebrosus TDB-379]|nr:hypothetical protein M405DRAFT_881908 [Rhizopogon salebrosus TDB-379]